MLIKVMYLPAHMPWSSLIHRPSGFIGARLINPGQPGNEASHGDAARVDSDSITMATGATSHTGS